MATLRDIADAVGVSIRTVSRALSGSGYVGEAVRSRILETADALGYSPDPVAQSLRLGRSREFVVIAPSVDELHLAKIAGMEEALERTGYSLSIVIARGFSPAVAGELADRVRRRKPAGVAVIASGHDATSIVDALQECALRVVSVDAPEVEPSVRLDRPAGVADAVRYLVDTGRRRICYVGPAGSTERLAGYRRAIGEAGFTPVEIDPGEGSLYRRSVRRLLATRPRIDAIQAYSDERALQLLSGLHDQGVRVPEDVAIVGFDDRWAARYSWPPLTTVAQPSRELGVAAANWLTGAATDPVVVIPTRLVVREST